MEREYHGLSGEKKINHNPLIFVEEMPLESMVELRKGSVMSPETPVSIFSDLGNETEKFEVLIQKPLKKDDLLKMISDFTELKFRDKYLAELWSGYNGGTNIYANPVAGLVNLLQGENSAMSEFGPKLAEVLESEDDSKFIVSIVRGIKTHSAAWRSVISGNDFIQNVSKLSNSNHSSIHGYEEPIAQFITEFPVVLRNEKYRNPETIKEPINFNNFATHNAQARADFVTSTLAKSINNKSEFVTFQKKLIDGIVGIRFEHTPEDSETIYFVGEQDNIDIDTHKSGVFKASKGKFSAKLHIENDGKVIVLPNQKNYVLPVFCFQNTNGVRTMRMKSDVVYEVDNIKVPYKKERIEVIYAADDENVSPLAGLLVMYDMLMQVGRTKVPAEAFPYAALLEEANILKKKFFEKIERTTENSNVR